jgi:hypothetical protein
MISLREKPRLDSVSMNAPPSRTLAPSVDYPAKPIRSQHAHILVPGQGLEGGLKWY